MGYLKSRYLWGALAVLQQCCQCVMQVYAQGYESRQALVEAGGLSYMSHQHGGYPRAKQDAIDHAMTRTCEED